MNPDQIQIIAACRTLSAAGFSMHVPGTARLELVSANRRSQLWDISEAKARAIISELPGSVRLSGGDLRARVSDLEEYLAGHPIRPGA